uniref:Uncharacterized protein n=1 Tax=Amphimedon queenslandica TaxID=400682 RepID=A0A1X7U3N0_AMPQE
SNYFQVALAFQSNASYAVFIYKCGLIRWTFVSAFIGIYFDSNSYIAHPLSNTFGGVTDIDCYDVVSGWTNVVYKIDQVINKFEFLSITQYSFTVSWEIIPNNSSMTILSITDSYQTVNNTISVTQYNNNVHNYTEDIHLCNIYTFKLTLSKTEIKCYNDNTKIISTALTPKPDNVSAIYLNNETLVIRFQIHYCFRHQIQLLLAGTNSFDTSEPLDINSLQYIDEYYIIHWNIKLKSHLSYYLTVSAIGTHEIITSDATKISKYNVKDITIERSEGIVCFVCVTEMFNECQVMIASVATTLIPQSTQTNGTCYSFTDNGRYTVYAHDIENGLIILTPAVVIQYTVDWIEPSDTEMIFSSIDTLASKWIKPVTETDQSYTSTVLGVLFALSTCAGIILLIILVAILRKKGKDSKIRYKIVLNIKVKLKQVILTFLSKLNLI